MDSKKITKVILGILAFVALTTGAMETILGIPVQSRVKARRDIPHSACFPLWLLATVSGHKTVEKK